MAIESAARNLTSAEVAALNSPAVVFIRTEFELLDSSGQVTATEARTGSGFVVSESGLVVTNRHLVRDWEYNKPSAGTESVSFMAVSISGSEKISALFDSRTQVEE